MVQSFSHELFVFCSPSGCTFWGKKPWSRKKKILWQLGTLVGAPVGISLIAGVAVPAIIIGVPIWVGRKVNRSQYIHCGTGCSYLTYLHIYISWMLIYHPIVMDNCRQTVLSSDSGQKNIITMQINFIK